MISKDVQQIIDYVLSTDKMYYLEAYIHNKNNANYYLCQDMKKRGIQIDGFNWTKNYLTAIQILFKDFIVQLTLDHLTKLKENDNLTAGDVEKFTAHFVLASVNNVQAAYLYYKNLGEDSKIDIYQAVIEQAKSLKVKAKNTMLYLAVISSMMQIRDINVITLDQLAKDNIPDAAIKNLFWVQYLGSDKGEIRLTSTGQKVLEAWYACNTSHILPEQQIVTSTLLYLQFYHLDKPTNKSIESALIMDLADICADKLIDFWYAMSVNHIMQLTLEIEDSLVK